jgi:hypothetical protein
MAYVDTGEVPTELQSRAKRERAPHRDISKNFYEDLGPLNDLRERVANELVSGHVNIDKLDLGGVLGDIAYRRENPLPHAPPRQRKLPEKNDNALQNLFNVVAGLRQDVRLIKDAQSKAGAEDWIVRNGLEHQLYVDDKDIDGDNIPDIIVRNRTTKKPYIVKGYTTEQSNYPMRHLYHSKYPTAEKRKGHPMRDFIDDEAVDEFDDGGFVRNYTANYKKYAEDAVKAGYKFRLPSKKLTNNQAFKYFIMKPLTKAFKTAADLDGTKVTLDAQLMRRMESYFRDNVITVPIMRMVYGDGIFEIDRKEWNKLAQRKAVKEGCKAMIKQVIEHRLEGPVIISLVSSFVDILEKTQIISLTAENRQPVINLIIRVLDESEDWQQDRLPREGR